MAMVSAVVERVSESDFARLCRRMGDFLDDLIPFTLAIAALIGLALVALGIIQ